MDYLLDLAFTMRSTPGSYVALLGAGVSRSSGVLSAWDVQLELVRQLALARGEDLSSYDDDGTLAWYRKTFDEAPAYGSILARTAPSEHSRQALLRSMFEPSEDERDRGEKTPTVAHSALADLVASGHLKIILTTNFDLLMETALRARNIEPIVVAHPQHVAGLPPLHTLQALVIHLHGSYLEPTSMLNTDDELSAYSEAIDALLDDVLKDRALLIAGWSSSFDPALRNAIDRSTKRFFRSYWVEPQTFNESAAELANRHAIQHVEGGADEAITRLSSAVQALASRSNAAHPLTVPIAVSTAKRLLGLTSVPIELHDAITREFDSIAQWISDTRREQNARRRPEALIRNDLDDVSAVALALIATSAYWGNAETDAWWAQTITTYAEAATHSGGSAGVQLQVASSFTFASGVASLARGRTETLVEILARGTAARETLWEIHPVFARGEPGASMALALQLRALFVGELAIGADRFTDIWEEFELLFAVADVLVELRKPVNLSQAREIEESLPTMRLRLMNAVGLANEREERDALAALEERRIGLIAYLSGVVRADAMHVRGSYHHSLPATRPGGRLLKELEEQKIGHPLVHAGFGTEWEIRLAIEAVHVSIREYAQANKWDPSTARGRVTFWLDAPDSPV